MNLKKAVARSSILLLLSSTALWAGTTGKIAGRITEARTGESLAGVNVVIEGTTLGAATDLNGNYAILNVPPGSYTLSASMIGYTKKRVTDVRVSIDLTTKVDLQLEPTVLELGQEVMVVAEHPVIIKDLTSVAAHVDAERIRTMPVQEVREVINLQSGVTVGSRGDIHIRGGRTSEVAYWVDGVSVTDVYDGRISVEVENQSVQELQVISGTFNAEYGQAMSGIVNIVTKEGQDRYHGNLRVYSGDYVSNDKERFYNIDEVNPVANYNAQGSLSGPVPLSGKRGSFFVASRYVYDDGWLYGQRFFTPTGARGDSSAVAMNYNEKLSLQGKLSFRLSPVVKINLSGLGSRVDYRDYNHDFRWEPDGDVTKHDRGYTVSFLWTHSLSPESFYTVDISQFYKKFYEYLYESPLDARYVHPDSLIEPSFGFHNVGTNMHHFKRHTTRWVGKADFTSQVTPLHQVRTGVEVRFHKLFLDEFYITAKRDSAGKEITPFVPEVLPTTTPTHDTYTRRPLEFSAYVQDKIEYKNVIINVGLRFDYFHPKANILADPEDPNIYAPFKPKHQQLSFSERQQIWYKRARAKYQLSPRFGIAYPITDRGVIHFSYGHFLQIPSFLYLYNRSDYKLTASGTLQGVFGDPDLKPQRTVMYELGLQQQLTEQIKVDLTGFYRDVRNWVTTSPPINTAIPNVSYTKFINRDYANVRGVTLSLNKRLSNSYSFDVQYTFQVAEGSNSDPTDEYFALLGNREPTRQIIPLNWDQTHTLNASVFVGTPDVGVGLISRYGSGLPYSPVIGTTSRQGRNLATGLRENSRRRPTSYTVDLRAYRSFRFGALRVMVFAYVFNLFDRRNEVEVFGDTGRAGYTLQAQNVSESAARVNPVAVYFNRPDFYSPPREVQVGVDVEF